MEFIREYFPGLSAGQVESFEKLGALYKEWNRQINVISRKDIDHLYTRHILYSLAIAKIITFKPRTRILDVGTGGGFPGIPLAIMFPDSYFHLIDSVGKKITVVNEVVKSLNMQNVVGEQLRVETLKKRYDFVVSRAVTRFDKFRKITQKNISGKHSNSLKNGIIYLKGGDFSDELRGVEKQTTLYDIGDFFEDPFFETKKVVHTAIK